MWGLDLRGWETAMLISLGFAAIAAFAVVLATAVVVRLQHIEAEEATKELDAYKSEAAQKIAEANSEAAKANESTAKLNNETARLTAENLALQTVLLPRHVGLIGINEQPKAQTWFAGFEKWARTKVLIQTVPGDPEAQNLANEIAIVLSKFGWIPEFIDEKRSGVSLNLTEGLSVFSPASHKAWDPKNEAQVRFAALRNAAISLANALTNAGLGIGQYPVEGSNGLMMIVDFPPDSEGEAHNPFRNFSPKLDGVYLQVGSRPVGSTMQWIRQGRPDAAGNKPAPDMLAEPHK